MRHTSKRCTTRRLPINRDAVSSLNLRFLSNEGGDLREMCGKLRGSGYLWVVFFIQGAPHTGPTEEDNRWPRAVYSLTEMHVYPRSQEYE